MNIVDVLINLTFMQVLRCNAIKLTNKNTKLNKVHQCGYIQRYYIYEILPLASACISAFKGYVELLV